MTQPFTPAYVSMAKAAKEVQALRPYGMPFHVGDWYEWEDSGIEVAVEKESDSVINCKEMVWLPRLDQLLAILGSPSDFIQIATMAMQNNNVDIQPEYKDITDWQE